MDVAELHAAFVDMVRTAVQTNVERQVTPYGVIVRDVHRPLVHMANMAWIDRLPERGVPELLEDTDSVFSGTPVRHRYFLFADAQAAYEAQDVFAASGFRPDADLVLAKVGLPSCVVNPDVVVREVGPEASEDDYQLVRGVLHAESGYGMEESRQILAVERERAVRIGERFFVGYFRDEPVATYTLWPRGIFAVIGNVGTTPKFRMQGVGRTMIFDACRQGINARCEYALLTADLFDTPQAMYKTLGFEPVGELRGFLRRSS